MRTNKTIAAYNMFENYSQYNKRTQTLKSSCQLVPFVQSSQTDKTNLCFKK